MDAPWVSVLDLLGAAPSPDDDDDDDLKGRKQKFNGNPRRAAEPPTSTPRSCLALHFQVQQQEYKSMQCNMQAMLSKLESEPEQVLIIWAV